MIQALWFHCNALAALLQAEDVYTLRYTNFEQEIYIKKNQLPTSRETPNFRLEIPG
jgi:hypothetical protein